MQTISKWLRDVKAYVSRSSEGEKTSKGEDDPIPENAAGDEALAENEGDDDPDAFANDDEGERLAEATIISEDTGQSNAGVDGEGNLDGLESQGELLENDDMGLEALEAEGSFRSNNLEKVAFIRKKRSVLVGFVVAIMALVAFKGIRLMEETARVEEAQGLPVLVYQASIDGGDYHALYFDRFLILLDDDGDEAYLSLSLSVMPSNKKVFGEVMAKMGLCRGLIYEILRKAATRGDRFAEGDTQLSKDILKALNKVLATGTVDKVQLSEFLVV
jgi:flagellar basal body-associated protein FliL